MPAPPRTLLDEFRRAMRPGISGASYDLRPSELFHYTSAAAFEQIARSGTLRATNFRFLDDPTEVSYGLGLVLPELKGQSENASGRIIKAFWQRTADMVSEAALTDFYICCFSGTEDDVSQWRAYGGGPVRYALGFDSEEFYDVTKQLAGRLDSVLYKQRTQRDHIDSVVEKALRFLATHRVGQRHVEAFAAVAARHFVRLMTRFKSPKYTAEQEWRIIIEKPSTFSDGVCFDASRGFLRPFIPVRLAAEGESLSLLSVWVLAPGRTEAALKAASLVLQSAKILNVTPQASAVPIAF